MRPARIITMLRSIEKLDQDKLYRVKSVYAGSRGYRGNVYVVLKNGTVGVFGEEIQGHIGAKDYNGLNIYWREALNFLVRAQKVKKADAEKFEAWIEKFEAKKEVERELKQVHELAGRHGYEAVLTKVGRSVRRPRRRKPGSE